MGTQSITYPNDNLIAGEIITEQSALEADTYYRGMRLETLAAVTPAAGANTGNGTVTLAEGNEKTQTGVYNLLCIDGAGGDVMSIGAAVPGANTGNGTVTAPALVGTAAKPGNYLLVCDDGARGDTRAIAAAVADPANTGNGTITAQALVGAVAKIGTYTVECIAAGIGGTPTSTLGAVPDGGNTGDGTIAAPTYGADTLAGVYRLECIDALVPGSEIFSVVTPTGILFNNATVGVPFASGHINFTIVAGMANFIVGDFFLVTVFLAHGGRFQVLDPDGIVLNDNLTLPGTPAGNVIYTGGGIQFTLNDGAADFILADSFTIAVTGEHGGLFILYDPDNIVINDNIILPGSAGGNVAVLGGGISFTLTDGAADFITGDSFTIPVSGSHGGVFQLTAPDGRVLDRGITLPGTPAGHVHYVGDELLFTLTDGAVDFITGDSFTMTVGSTRSYRAIANGNLTGIYNDADARVLTGPGYGYTIIHGEVYEGGLRSDVNAEITLTSAQRMAYARNGFYVKPR